MTLFATLLLSFILLLVTKSSSEEPGQRLGERRYNGLKFGPTKQDFVLLKLNMSPRQVYYSVCGWVKKIRTDVSRPFWFAFGTREGVNKIQSTDNGYFYTLGINLDLRSNVTDLIGTWRHMCLTWRLSTRTARAYIDGTEIGSRTTPSGRGPWLDGYLVLGNEFDKYGRGFQDRHAFGGELYKVNVFNKELSAGQVKEMSDSGMCSDVEDKYGERRRLKWEEMVLEEKSGNVIEIGVGCYVLAVIADLKKDLMKTAG